MDTITEIRRDGRHRRSDRSRAALLAACRSLLSEGNFRPSMRAVCREAGVSVRTGFDQFSTIETLYREVLQDENTVKSIARHVIQDDSELNAIWPVIIEKIVRSVVLGRPGD